MWSGDDPRSSATAPRDTRQQVMPMEEQRASSGQALAGVETFPMRMSDQCADLFGALAEAQGKFESAIKTMTANIVSRKEGGASYKFAYAPLSEYLSAVRGPMSECGLAVLQFPYTRRGSVVLRTIITHKSGQWILNDLSCAIFDQMPQSIGSAITYLRKYALQSIVGIAPEDDDDGQTAQSGDPGMPRSGARKPAEKPVEKPAEKPATPAAAAKPEEARPENVGKIVSVRTSTTGATIAKLHTNCMVGTRDAELIKSINVFRSMDATVRFVFDQPDDPKAIPLLKQIEIAKADVKK